MNKKELNEAFERMKPDQEQKMRMLREIETQGRSERPAGKGRKTRRSLWISAAAACLALVFAVVFIFPPGKETVALALSVGSPDVDSKVKLTNDHNAKDGSTSVSNINARPGLEFYIEGKDIAKIEVSCENEFLYVVDWTKTQQEKYWNPEVYQKFDEETQQSIFYPELLYDKACELTFPQDFDAYDEIWYRWEARNLYEWASADNFSHFQGVGIEVKYATEEDKLKAAAGNSSANGHILLDGYPVDKLSDNIHITITDRQGNIVTKTIVVTVTNNEIGQTVVTANLED